MSITPAVEIDVQNESGYVFVPETTDERAPERSGEGNRVSACMFGSPEFTFQTRVRDGRSYTVGFYLLDWDNSGRIMDIKVESETGEILDARQVTRFVNGKYLFWRVQGTTVFRFSAPSVNAVVSAFFVEEAMTPYDLWRNNLFTRSEFLEMEGNFDQGDFDKDGFSNGLEYALGFDPRVASDSPELTWSYDRQAFAVRVTRRIKRDDVRAQFEESTDLITWNALPESEEGIVSEIVVRSGVSEERRFWRIRTSRVQ